MHLYAVSHSRIYGLQVLIKICINTTLHIFKACKCIQILALSMSNLKIKLRCVFNRISRLFQLNVYVNGFLYIHFRNEKVSISIARSYQCTMYISVLALIHLFLCSIMRRLQQCKANYSTFQFLLG